MLEYACFCSSLEEEIFGISYNQSEIFVTYIKSSNSLYIDILFYRHTAIN